MPSAYADGMTVVPFRHFIPIVLAAIVVGGLHSSMSEIQSTATSVLRRYEVGYLVCAATAAIVLLGVAEALATSAASALLVIRGFVVWIGLALLSGRLFGWLTNWLLPVLTVFPLVYYSLDDVGEVRWWNWTGQPSGDAASWLIAATSLAAGAAAFTLTPWRLPRMTAHFRPSQGVAPTGRPGVLRHRARRIGPRR
ncbi:hypothetical protein [Actinomadura spongiicola]|uniref:hypothetical protein n=1 Tax=Actinomadura spongiicola TaxID=2303421 RepID=UPI0011C1C63A|nr:hypothetical protein [Actinomadura spongiicola]